MNMSYKSNYPDIFIPEKSLSNAFLKRIAKFGDDVAMIDNTRDGISITFNELSVQIRRCAGFLHGQGLAKGDVVGLCAGACLEFPAVMFGIIACGATVTMCNPAYSKGEVMQQFNITEPKMVFVDEQGLETIKHVKQDLSCLQKIFLIGNSEEIRTFSSMMKPEYEKDFSVDVGINPVEDVAIIPYSSGTTGLPKCVMLTHKNLVATAEIAQDVYNHDKEACFYLNRPMYHVGGFELTITRIWRGMKLVIDKESDVEKLFTSIEKYKVTQILATPDIMMEMANTERYKEYDLSSLKYIICAGAALSDMIMCTLNKLYKVQVIPAYAMTECAPISTNHEIDKFPTSVGSIIPNTTVKIVDLKTNENLGCDKVGGILVKGPQVMKGYLKNPEASNAAIDKDGWLHTGDIGHVDKHNMLYVIDRMKEVIKYKTIQVSPAELEGILLKHDKIADVGVIGIPDSYAGELPKAFVVRKNISLTKEEVIQFVKDELVDYKQLRGGVDFIDFIPRSATGKIQRGELKKMTGL